MKVINLTLPLYDHMPVGNVWAWDTPFKHTPITTYEDHGAHLVHLSLHNETGTRLMYAATFVKNSPRVYELDWGQFVNRDVVVVDIPKGERGEITGEDVYNAVAKDADIQRGDGVLIRTGWGTTNRHWEIKDDYAIKTPHFTDEGATATVEVLRSKGSDLMLTDCAYVGNCGGEFMLREWVSLPPWQRPAWPSDIAKTYLRHYTPEYGKGGRSGDWRSSAILLENLFVIDALCSMEKITKKRIKITALPMNLAIEGGAPCSVVAIEE